MGLATRMAVTVTLPVVTGVLVWWGVMLAAPALLIRRWRRRHRGAPQRRLWPSAVRARRSKGSPRSPGGPLGGAVAPGRLAADPARLADADDVPRPSVGALPAHGQTPPPRALADSNPAVSLTDETLEPLCRYVDFRRRLELAADLHVDDERVVGETAGENAPGQRLGHRTPGRLVNRNSESTTPPERQIEARRAENPALAGPL